MGLWDIFTYSNFASGKFTKNMIKDNNTYTRQDTLRDIIEDNNRLLIVLNRLIYPSVLETVPLKRYVSRMRFIQIHFLP